MRVFLSLGRDKHLFYIRDILSECLVYAHKVLDRRTCMKDCGMVLAADFGTDGRKGAFQQIAAHVHGNLAGLDDLALP